MVRWIPLVGMLWGLAGCGESPPTRLVPVSPSTPSASGVGEAATSNAATRPPRAIATH